METKYTDQSMYGTKIRVALYDQGIFNPSDETDQSSSDDEGVLYVHNSQGLDLFGNGSLVIDIKGARESATESSDYSVNDPRIMIDFGAYQFSNDFAGASGLWLDFQIKELIGINRQLLNQDIVACNIVYLSISSQPGIDCSGFLKDQYFKRTSGEGLSVGNCDDVSKDECYAIIIELEPNTVVSQVWLLYNSYTDGSVFKVYTYGSTNQYENDQNEAECLVQSDTKQMVYDCNGSMQIIKIQSDSEDDPESIITQVLLFGNEIQAVAEDVAVEDPCAAQLSLQFYDLGDLERTTPLSELDPLSLFYDIDADNTSFSFQVKLLDADANALNNCLSSVSVNLSNGFDLLLVATQTELNQLSDISNWTGESGVVITVQEILSADLQLAANFTSSSGSTWQLVIEFNLLQSFYCSEPIVLDSQSSQFGLSPTTSSQLILDLNDLVDPNTVWYNQLNGASETFYCGDYDYDLQVTALGYCDLNDSGDTCTSQKVENPSTVYYNSWIQYSDKVLYSDSAEINHYWQDTYQDLAGLQAHAEEQEYNVFNYFPGEGNEWSNTCWFKQVDNSITEDILDDSIGFDTWAIKRENCFFTEEQNGVDYQLNFAFPTEPGDGVCDQMWQWMTVSVTVSVYGQPWIERKVLILKSASMSEDFLPELIPETDHNIFLIPDAYTLTNAVYEQPFDLAGFGNIWYTHTSMRAQINDTGLLPQDVNNIQIQCGDIGQELQDCIFEEFYQVSEGISIFIEWQSDVDPSFNYYLDLRYYFAHWGVYVHGGCEDYTEDSACFGYYYHTCDGYPRQYNIPLNLTFCTSQSFEILPPDYLPGTYELGSQVELQFDEYEISPECNYMKEIEYDLQVTNHTIEALGASISQEGVLSIESNDGSLIGTQYELIIKAVLKEADEIVSEYSYIVTYVWSQSAAELECIQNLEESHLAQSFSLTADSSFKLPLPLYSELTQEVLTYCQADYQISTEILSGYFEDEWLVLDETVFSLELVTPEITQDAEVELTILITVISSGILVEKEFKIQITISQNQDSNSSQEEEQEENDLVEEVDEENSQESISVIFDYQTEGQEELFPIKPQLMYITPTGLLTIYFNRQIFEQKDQLDTSTSKRMLENESSNGQVVNDNSQELNINNFIGLQVVPSSNELSRAQLAIAKLKQVEAQYRTLRLQIYFEYPNNVSRDMTEPDSLAIIFKDKALNIDGFQQIEHLQIPRQQSIEEYELARSFGNQVQSATKSISILLLISLLLLGYGLKFIWNSVNILQFIVFMVLWNINLPSKALKFIQGLKQLALFEFIPYEEILQWFGKARDKLSFDQEPDERIGTSRIAKGAENWLEDGGSFLILGVIVIFTAVFVTIVIKIKCKCCAKGFHTLTTKIQSKIFYNGMIRYLLTSSLKLLLVYVGLLTTELSKVDSFTVTTSSMLTQYFAYLLLTAISFSYFYFIQLLGNNSKKLNKASTKQQIGSLYQGLKPKANLIEYYILVFYLRRVLFTAITFALFEHSALQIASFSTMSIVYLSFILNVNFHKKNQARYVEVFNECLLCLFTYHLMMIQATTAIQFNTVNSLLATSIICVVCILIGSNFLFLSLKVILRIKKKLKARKADRVNKVLERKPQTNKGPRFNLLKINIDKNESDCDDQGIKKVQQDKLTTEPKTATPKQKQELEVIEEDPEESYKESYDNFLPGEKDPWIQELEEMFRTEKKEPLKRSKNETQARQEHQQPKFSIQEVSFEFETIELKKFQTKPKTQTEKRLVKRK